MEVNVNVNVELGPKTLGFLTGLPKVSPIAELKEDNKAIAAKKEKTVEAPKRAPKAEVKQETPFKELDDDAKLEAIKAEVTKHTKKGKSADIKALLTGFDAGRASELTPEDYEAFYNAVKRYGAGESVDDILGLD